jgi:hypothetical protein
LAQLLAVADFQQLRTAHERNETDLAVKVEWNSP